MKKKKINFTIKFDTFKFKCTYILGRLSVSNARAFDSLEGQDVSTGTTLST
jgi:hypothetical protein